MASGRRGMTSSSSPTATAAIRSSGSPTWSAKSRRGSTWPSGRGQGTQQYDSVLKDTRPPPVQVPRRVHHGLAHRRHQFGPTIVPQVGRTALLSRPVPGVQLHDDAHADLRADRQVHRLRAHRVSQAGAGASRVRIYPPFAADPPVHHRGHRDLQPAQALPAALLDPRRPLRRSPSSRGSWPGNRPS